MASEDSKKRDGRRKFIVSTMAAIRAMPATLRWSPARTMRTTVENLSNASTFAVLSGFASKKGTTWAT